ncbi:hypothetical protein NECAME_09200 [Necator americanus]|uniref:Uncharacterized protein n=1 Tax=Necator americanus TaxID=51031 RepID=W2TED1_NECAM|nr:hypothetical protein NECAME_09200 [Necator americanus]ETN80410.1 hypothetical protein NECAME_09200 [Necator americanus]
MTMYVILLALLVPLVSSIGEYGPISSQLPTVALFGEPRLIARRIWRGQQNITVSHTVNIENVHQNVLQREPYHAYPVNAIQVEGPVQGHPVTVYTRILRPAKLIFTGGDVVTHQWKGGDDNYERQEFHRQPHASAIQEFGRKL